MVGNARSRWAVNGASFLLWALAAASAVYWGLKLGGSSGGAVPAPLPQRPAAAADPAAVARLLGGPVAGPAAAPSLASRLSLVGVVAGLNDASQGAALIAVDGKPAKPFRVGALVDGGLLLQSVQGRRAVLAAGADGPAALTLELPPPRK